MSFNFRSIIDSTKLYKPLGIGMNRTLQLKRLNFLSFPPSLSFGDSGGNFIEQERALRVLTRKGSLVIPKLAGIRPAPVTKAPQVIPKLAGVHTSPPVNVANTAKDQAQPVITDQTVKKARLGVLALSIAMLFLK